tara:strand:+ start:221 stop:598 length:378 start_codon:yes stop_codon:yes gene_type:complete
MGNKTEKIKVGDLVRMPRRRTEGMGIVLKYSDDLAAEGGVDVMKVLNETKELIRYADRTQIFKNAFRRCGDSEFLEQAFYYNAGWNRKPKLRFAYVKWIQKPSAYTADILYHDERWYPVDWLKSY